MRTARIFPVRVLDKLGPYPSTMADRVGALLDDLRVRGERVTPARRAVIEELVAAEGHLTVDDLVERVHQTVPRAHLATIYRTMDILERLGIVQHTHLGHGSAVYHLVDDLHVHLVCESCGAVVQMPPSLLSAVERRARQEHGFALRTHHFALVGRCQSCQPVGSPRGQPVA
jgi:Fur family ferric uptake transcriptional regulator